MDTDVGGWKDLLHSSTKLLEQAAPSSQFPPIQRSLDQLEAMSKKLKAKTLRTETPSQSIAATRLLAREGINAEQLARDLKSFELKTTFEDVFPVEATTVEEYLKQVHEMAITSAIHEAQKDNLKSFNAYMMKKAEDDWKKEKGDFLQSLSRLSTLPRTDSGALVSGSVQPGPMSALISRSKVSSVPSGVNVTSLTNTPVFEKKAAVYGEVVRSLNDARERSLPFKPAASFSAAYDGLALETAGKKSVGIRTIWHLIQSLVGENISTRPNVSKKMLLVIGSRHHLEWGHEKFIMDTIQSHPAQAALGGAVGNLHKIQAFLRVRLRDQGVLDFDAGDARRQPPIDTTWQQIYFCLRTGYYNEARSIAQSSHVARQFASMLAEWITSGGVVSRVTAAAAAEECEKMLRIGDHAGRASDRKKLLLYAIVSGCRRLIDRLLRDIPSMFSNIEDFLWFKLAAIRDYSGGASSTVLAADWVPYTLDDLQTYLNKFEPSYYTKNGKDPLFYPYVLLLSTQLLSAMMHLSKETGEEGYHIDAVHMAIALADHGVISESTNATQTLGTMDSFAEISGMIRQFGSVYLRQGNLSMAVEYFAQAGAAVGGGKLSWSGNVSVENQRRRDLMLKQLLTDILLSDGGIALLLGSRGAGEGGALRRFINDEKAKQQFLLEAARQCQEAGLYDKSIEIRKRIGAYGMALETINKCLSDAVCALLRGRSDSESHAAGFIHSGNEIVESYKYSSDSGLHDKQFVSEQLILRQLEAILFVSKLARSGHYTDALREIVKLQFLPLDPRSSEVTSSFETLSPHVQACVPDLLKVALNCLDQMTESDGSIRAMKNKITSFVAAHRARNWPQDLYEKVAQNL